MTGTNSLGQGFGYALSGFRLIWRPELRPYALVPILVNLLIFGLLIWLGVLGFEGAEPAPVYRGVWLTVLTGAVVVASRASSSSASGTAGGWIFPVCSSAPV